MININHPQSVPTHLIKLILNTGLGLLSNCASDRQGCWWVLLPAAVAEVGGEGHVMVLARLAVLARAASACSVKINLVSNYWLPTTSNHLFYAYKLGMLSITNAVSQGSYNYKQITLGSQ